MLSQQNMGEDSKTFIRKRYFGKDHNILANVSSTGVEVTVNPALPQYLFHRCSQKYYL